MLVVANPKKSVGYNPDNVLPSETTAKYFEEETPR